MLNYQPNSLKTELAIDDIISLHYFNFTKTYDFPGESHDFWEIVFVDSGEITVSDGVNSHVLEQGQIILHHPNVFHDIATNNQYSNIFIVTFNSRSKKLYDVPRQPITVSDFDKRLISIILEEGKRTFVEPLNLIYLEKMTKVDNPPFGAEQRIKQAIEMLLISLIRRDGEDNALENEAAVSHLRIVNEVKATLKENVRSKITLQFLSDTLGYSKTYLKIIFKKQTGTSIIKYFNSLKILEAKKLISENEYSISDIANMLGYESVQYFSTQFKNYTNMTPSAYLKSVKLLQVL